MSSATLTRLREEYLARRPTLPESVIGAARRSEAIETLCAEGLPSTGEENWRYTNLRILERARFTPALEATQPLPPLPAPLAGFARYVFVDGQLRSGASDPRGVSVRSLRSSGSAAEPWQFAAQLPEARLALLNEAFATDAATIDVRGEAESAGIELVFVAASGAQSGAVYPRVRLALQPGAQLTVVERHLGAGEGSSLVNSAVRVELADNARLTHYRVQDCGTRAAWFDTLSAQLSTDARYDLLLVSTGALTARSTVHARLTGNGAELALSAAALGEGQQSLDMYALSEHLASHTRTQQTFRGIASDRARVAFNGKIAVHEQARGIRCIEQHHLGHSVEQRRAEALERGAAERRLGAHAVLDAALDPLHRSEAAGPRDIARLARPRREGALARHHPQSLPAFAPRREGRSVAQ